MTDVAEQTSTSAEDLRNEIMSANSFADLETPLLHLNRRSLDRTDKNAEYRDVLNLLVEKVRTLTLARNGGPLLVELLLIAPIAARLDAQIPSRDIWNETAQSAFKQIESVEQYSLDEVLPWLLFNSLAKGCTGSLCDLVMLPGLFAGDSGSHIRPQLVQKVLSEGQWLHEIDATQLSIALKKRVSLLREKLQVNKFLFLCNFLCYVVHIKSPEWLLVWPI